MLFWLEISREKQNVFRGNWERLVPGIPGKLGIPRNKHYHKKLSSTHLVLKIGFLAISLLSIRLDSLPFLSLFAPFRNRQNPILFFRFPAKFRRREFPDFFPSLAVAPILFSPLTDPSSRFLEDSNPTRMQDEVLGATEMEFVKIPTSLPIFPVLNSKSVESAKLESLVESTAWLSFEVTNQKSS